MLELSRTIRFCLNTEANNTWADESRTPRHNTYAAWPPPAGLPRYYELKVTCRGAADPTTGYFINIKQIDTAARGQVLPLFWEAAKQEQHGQPASTASLLLESIRRLQPALNDTVASLELRLTPFTTLTIRTQPDDTMPYVLLKQRYEFSAAHRLHVPSLSDEENQRTFGKCNNPAGHGHNYVVEVAVRCPVDEHGHALSVGALDRAVDEAVIEKLDHTNLNVDVDAFADRNPSVEHIAETVWHMLADHIPSPAELDELSVWETGKTVCTFRGPGVTPPR